MMTKTKIGIIEGYTGAVLQTIGNAVRELNEQGYDVEVQARHQANEIEDGFWQWLKKDADAIFLYVNTSDERFDIIKEIVSRVNAPVFSMQEELSNVPLDVLAIAKQYHMQGGLENTKNLLLFMAQYCGKMKAAVPPPEELPWQGIYHPDANHLFESLNDYNAWYNDKKRGKHTVGLLLFRSAWLEGDTAMWNAVIKEFEGRGVNVIPVVSRGFEDKDLGIENNDAILSRYFIVDGKPVIDLLVNFQLFFLVPRAIKGWNEHSTEGIEILKKLNVPVIQAVRSYRKTLDEWKESGEGLDPIAIVMNVAMPEFDGIIEPILIGVIEKTMDATVGGTYNKHIPVQEQVEFLVERCIKWVNLRETPVSERKVAFILHNPPCKSVEATVGTGYGLDTLESVVRVFHRMEKEGYYLGNWVPDKSKELIDTIMERKAISEFRWTPLSEIVKKGGAAAMLDRDDYLKWFYDFPESAQNEIIGTWGDPASDFSKIKDINPDELSEEEQSEAEAITWAKLSMGLYDNKLVIPGVRFGNIFLTVQPKRGCAGARCDGEVCKILHDPTCPPPHQWLAVYKWIEKEFKADVIVHVGKHGYLEFLPGKSVGLSNECYPQISLGTVPHLYIYIVNNPMEGTIAKRRGYATLVDHLIPVMAPSGLYEGLEDLEDLLAQYNKAKTTNDEARLRSLLQLITEKAQEVNLLKELKDEEEVVAYLHGQLTLLRETQIRDGLHILGAVPSGKNLANLVVSILRFDIGEHPSIRRCILECMGLDYEEIIENPAAVNNEFGKTNGELLDESTKMAVKIFEQLLSGVDAESLPTARDSELLSTCKEVLGCDFKKGSEDLVKTVTFGVSLIPKIARGVNDEITNLIRGFNSEYIESGASGALTRGKIDVLPTGRNFYAIDPMSIPTQAAWKIGIKLADALLEGYLEHEGKYPENIGFVLFTSDIFRADGEEVSQILYTMGARPVWGENGTVRSVEVIPLDELKRPRVDCTVRVGGIVRDTSPNIMALIDDAAQKIAALDEPVEMNYIRKHTLEKMKRLLEQYDEETAQRKASYRVFGVKPGAYGAGVNLAVLASAWKEDKDLADVFVDWSGYAYGKDVFGEENHTEFADLLKTVEVTYRSHESDEFDIFDCCCFFGYHGGFTIAAESISGKDVQVYHGDTRDPERPAIRDMKEEIERVVRTRLLNPKWIEGKKRHGYKGAGDISKRVDHVYGWSATTKLVEGWVYNEIAERFVIDEVMREWFKENNPWALEEMGRRLIEAAERELWEPDEELLKKLKESYLDLEGMMEEKLGVIEGDYQGGEITVLSKDDVDAWSAKVKGIEEVWKKREIED